MLNNLLEDIGFNAMINGKNGYCIYNKNDMYIGKSVEKYGEFSELEADMFKQICQKGDVVIEIGANIGTHTMILSKLVGETGVVLAYEPQRIVFQTLCANMSINSITNVHTFQEVVSSENGVFPIPEIDYNKTNNFGGISLEKFTKGTLVQKHKLDNLINRINKLKFIKIDVEGMESDVLKGAKELIKKFKPILYIENDRIEKSKELIELIQSYGYKLYWHLPPLYNKNNFTNDSDNIFGKIVSVNMLCISNDSKINIENMIEIKDSKFHPMKKEK